MDEGGHIENDVKPSTSLCDVKCSIDDWCKGFQYYDFNSTCKIFYIDVKGDSMANENCYQKDYSRIKPLQQQGMLFAGPIRFLQKRVKARPCLRGSVT